MSKQLGFIFGGILMFSVISSAAPAPEKTFNQKAGLYAELTGKKIEVLTETQLYSVLIEAHQLNSGQAFQIYLSQFIKRFPASTLLDNVYFMAAENALLKKDYPKALRFIAKIEKNYPLSSKRVSALLLKAEAYNQMNLPGFAKRSFGEVKKRYPGSPESFRANAELKLKK